MSRPLKAEEKSAGEKTLEQKILELERANQVKKEFLTIMSRELRTPLNTVMGYTAMIKEKLLGEINAQQEKALAKVLSRANDQLRIIQSVLYASALESGEVKTENHEISLADFLDNLRSSYKGPLDKEFKIHWDYPSDLPVVSTDSLKLRQILEHLIENAVRFTAKGRVTLSARYSPGTKTAEFKVADTSIEIPKEVVQAISEKSRQMDSSETILLLYGGVGLGLYIVKKSAAILGGEVRVESEPGKGSTFIVTIPGEAVPS